jgi:hypothetical protein
MSNILTAAEASLIQTYRSVSIPDRAAIVRQYAQATHLSLGRAEDALDLWVYMLANASRS